MAAGELAAGYSACGFHQRIDKAVVEASGDVACGHVMPEVLCQSREQRSGIHLKAVVSMDCEGIRAKMFARIEAGSSATAACASYIT